MIEGHLAQVYQVLPDRHGVLVVFRDGTFTPDTERTFVRVLARRAHPKGGASTELPEVGELGLVLELEAGFLIWAGGIHLMADGENQVEPEAGARVHRDSAGIVSRSRANGDAEWMHPSGLRLTVSADGNPLPDLQRPGNPAASPVPVVELEHPSGGKLTITADGALTLDGFASVAFQGGAARFVMESLVNWLQGHVHTSAAAGSPTSAPTTQPPADALSPTSFTGPHA